MPLRTLDRFLDNAVPAAEFLYDSPDNAPTRPSSQRRISGVADIEGIFRVWILRGLSQGYCSWGIQGLPQLQNHRQQDAYRKPRI